MSNFYFPRCVPTRVWLLAATLWLVCHAPSARALSFSAQPTNQEFFAAHIFEDPLVPIGTTTATDNAALAQALIAFSQRSQAEDYSALTAFLSAYPQSPWRASLLTGMGIVYAHHGYFTRALDAWQTAWTLSKDSTESLERGVADRALSERARLYVRLGTTAPLQQLLKDSGGRELMGSARDRMRVSTEMLHFMVAKPDHAFRCGPFSLDAIGRYANPHQAYNPALIDVDDDPASAPTKDGLSLNQVHQIAQNVGMNYRMAKRSTGATLPLPAVIHWKSGHYSAAVAQDANGRYLLRDSNFGGDFWISQAALDEESSGYVLLGSTPQNITGGDTQAAQSTPDLPTGWQDVPEAEASTVWGGCHTGTSDPDCTGSDCECGQAGGGDSGSPGCAGCAEGPGAGGAASWAMATYSIHTLLVSLHIVDTPVGYAPPVGPSVYFNLSYDQREANQPANFNYMNFGGRWTCNWLSYVTDDPTNASANASVYLRGGGTKQYSSYNTSTGAYAPQRDNRTVLKRTSIGNAPVKYQLLHPNGSTEFYEAPDGSTSYPRKVFLTRVSDPQGNNISLGYDSALRLTTITDLVNPPTTVVYKSDTASINNSANLDFYRVAKVTDPFGRFATFDYTNGELNKITDVIGITSRFAYQGDFINQLTTPYGTTGFHYSDANTGSGISDIRILEVTDPYGAKERFEFHQDDTGLNGLVPMSDSRVPQGMNLTNDYLAYRNTFYWSKKSMVDDPSHPFTNAHIYHWLHDDNLNQITSVLESEKAPLENRVWYNYPDQPSPTSVGSLAQPTAVGRVLDDGTTQLRTFTYNSVSNMTQAVEAALDSSSNPVNGRTIYYDYDATGMDRLMIRQATGATSVILEKRVYDPSCPPHMPKQIIDASGQTTSYTYNAQGQTLTVTNAKNEKTTWNYTRTNTSDGPADGYLYSVTGAMSDATTTYTYDTAGRRSTLTNSDKYKLVYSYDALNRLLATSFPDNTSTKTIYDRLDPEWTCDRLGRWTHTFHDALRHVVAVQDPLGRTTNFGFCLCGAMTSLTDSAGNTTRWAQDIQGRQTSKTYPDGTQIVYAYENSTSRLKSVTDQMSQITSYTYSVDNYFKRIDYAGTNTSMSSVLFNYDPVYNRLTSMTDGTGVTSYNYGPYSTYSSYTDFPSNSTSGSGQLVRETKVGSTGFASYTINCGYDQLRRQTSLFIDDPANRSGVDYDSLGRVVGVTDPLGTFSYSYVGTTRRLDFTNYPNGQQTTYSYSGNTGDNRLHQIKNLSAAGAATPISQSDYNNDAVGNITNWTQDYAGATNAVELKLQYDNANQLGVVEGAVSGEYGYWYDSAGNRTSEQVGSSVSSATFNALNQIKASSGSDGKVVFRGVLSQPGTVTVGGVVATMDAGNNFMASVPVQPGSNTVQIVATDNNGNVTTKQVQLAVTSGTSNATFTYDSNGNMTSDGSHVFEWDAANRLTAINYVGTNPAQRTEFAYSGLGQRVRQIEKSGTTITSSKCLVWFGKELQEERDVNNQISKRYYLQGMVIGSTIPVPASAKFFYTRDHLGSVREMTDSSTIVRARYDYDPFGRRSTNKVAASSGVNPVESDFAYTGYYYHAPSAMEIAYYRVYNSNIGKWISRDPLQSTTIFPKFDPSHPLVSRSVPLGVEITREGPNVYTYVKNNPATKMDLFGLDQPGCDSVRSIPGLGSAFQTPCALSCCAVHDACYFYNGCTASSWFNMLNPFSVTDCDYCNYNVVACLSGCKDPNCPVGPLYFDSGSTGNYIGFHD